MHECHQLPRLLLRGKCPKTLIITLNHPWDWSRGDPTVTDWRCKTRSLHWAVCLESQEGPVYTLWYSWCWYRFISLLNASDITFLHCGWWLITLCVGFVFLFFFLIVQWKYKLNLNKDVWWHDAITHSGDLTSSFGLFNIWFNSRQVNLHDKR